MAQVFDLQMLRSLAADIRCVYQALVRAHTLVDECRQMRQMADDLLRQAGLLYLTEGLAVAEGDGRSSEAGGAPANMASPSSNSNTSLLSFMMPCTAWRRTWPMPANGTRHSRC